MKLSKEEREELESFPTTSTMSSQEFSRYKREIFDHLKDHRANTVLITYYNRPRYVIMNAEAYLELIREE